MVAPLSGPSSGVGVVTYRVEEFDCATEENDLRAVLTPLPGVRSLEFDLVGRRVRVRHDLESPEPIEAAIRELGMRPSVVVGAEGASLDRSLSRRSIVVTVVAGLFAVGSEVAVILGADEQSVLVAVLAVIAIALGGRDTLRKGFQALRSRRMTMSLLMSVAVIGAIVDRAVARSGGGHLAVRCGRTDRGAEPGTGPQRDPFARRSRPGDGERAPRRRLGRRSRPVRCRWTR